MCVSVIQTKIRNAHTHTTYNALIISRRWSLFHSLLGILYPAIIYTEKWPITQRSISIPCLRRTDKKFPYVMRYLNSQPDKHYLYDERLGNDNDWF